MLERARVDSPTMDELIITSLLMHLHDPFVAPIDPSYLFLLAFGKQLRCSWATNTELKTVSQSPPAVGVHQQESKDRPLRETNREAFSISQAVRCWFCGCHRSLRCTLLSPVVSMQLLSPGQFVPLRDAEVISLWAKLPPKDYCAHLVFGLARVFFCVRNSCQKGLFSNCRLLPAEATNC